jgi:hypothetical protein
MQDTEKYCAVCKRDMRGEDDTPDVEICIECGERPAAPGEDMCLICLREIHRTEGIKPVEVVVETDPETAIDPLAPSDIEEIDVDMDAEEEIPSGELGEIDRELGMDDEDEEAEDNGEIVPESLEQLEEAEFNELIDEDEM